MKQSKIFIIAFLTLALFFSNRIYLNDEILALLQLQSVEKDFTIEVERVIVYVGMPWFEVNGKKYAPFSYLLPILAYPIYKIFLFLNNFGRPDLILALMAPAGFLMLSYIYRKYIVLSIAFFIATLILFKPIYRFEDWAGIYALKLINIIAISVTAEILYRMLKERFEEKVASSATLLFIFATPVAYWSLSAKLHAISLMLISISFYFFDKYLKSENIKCLFISSLIAGFCIFSRALDGAFLSLSIFLFLLLFRRRKLIYAILGAAIGYIPCAIFGLFIFNIPLPVEIIRDRFSNVSYIEEVSDPVETLLLIPFIFVGIKNNTLGILSYSPVIALLIPLAIRFLKTRNFNLLDFEKFLLLFSAICFSLYLPFLKYGVVETGVRDYRFLLPLYIPIAYLLAKAKVRIDFNSTLIVAICFTIPTILFVSLLDLYDLLSSVYLIISTILIFLFLFVDKIKNKDEIYSLAILPIVFIVSDVTRAYFSPYDIRFINPLLDRFIELLIWLKL